MSLKDRVPTGVAEDGTLFYTENDLIGPRGVKIVLLPSGDAPLRVMPSVARDCQDTITGNPTPITCSGPDGKKVYRCEHEVVPANPKTGTKPVVGVLKRSCDDTFYHAVSSARLLFTLFYQ